MKLDPYQVAFCKDTARYIRLLAPAGSGKTLALLHRCLFLSRLNSDKQEKFLIFSFTRVARDELQERLNYDRTFNSIRNLVQVVTLNQWGYKFLRKYRSGITLKTTKKDKFFLINNNLRNIWESDTRWRSVFENIYKSQYSGIIECFDELKTAGFRHDSSDLTSMIKANFTLLLKNGLRRFLEKNILQRIVDWGFTGNIIKLTPEDLLPFVTLWAKSSDHLWNSAIITFEDQKYWAWLKLMEKYSDSLVPESNRNHHILIDEFQDINPLDLNLIKEIQRVNQSSLTIVGDDDQAIFEWRGATSKFILSPEDHIQVNFQTHLLGINYRCPPNILAHSLKLIAHNNRRELKEVKSVLGVNADVKLRKHSTHMDCLEDIIELAKSAVDRGKEKSLAIIARKRSQLLPLQIKLTSQGIQFYTKEDLNILLSPALEDLRDVLVSVCRASEKGRYRDDVSRELVRLCDLVMSYPLKKKERQPLKYYPLEQRPDNLLSALLSLSQFPGTLKGFASDDLINKFVVPIRSVLTASNVSETIDSISQNLYGLQKHFAKSEDDVYFKEPPFLYLGEYAQEYSDDHRRFVEHLDDAMYLAKKKNQDDSDTVDRDIVEPVHLMTAQRAKGKEFETVVLLDVNDGIWPSKLAESVDEIEQERRIFYVALTRVKRNLIIYRVSSVLGKVSNDSRFLYEAGFLE